MAIRSRLAVYVVTFSLLAGACTVGDGPNDAPSTPASSAGVPIVACADAIDALAAPPEEYEVVLDVVALPTRTVLQAGDSGEPGWLFAKQGLVVRTHATVDLVIPADATEHVKIGWGNPAHPTAKLRLTGCTGSSTWLVFAGGYWVDAPACIPLIVRTGGRESRVRIPVGVACT